MHTIWASISRNIYLPLFFHSFDVLIIELCSYIPNSVGLAEKGFARVPLGMVSVKFQWGLLSLRDLSMAFTSHWISLVGLSFKDEESPRTSEFPSLCRLTSIQCSRRCGDQLATRRSTQRNKWFRLGYDSSKSEMISAWTLSFVQNTIPGRDADMTSTRTLYIGDAS